jgi:hypothetical protein
VTTYLIGSFSVYIVQMCDSYGGLWPYQIWELREIAVERPVLKLDEQKATLLMVVFVEEALYSNLERSCVPVPTLGLAGLPRTRSDSR